MEKKSLEFTSKSENRTMSFDVYTIPLCANGYQLVICDQLIGEIHAVCCITEEGVIWKCSKPSGELLKELDSFLLSKYPLGE